MRLQHRDAGIDDGPIMEPIEASFTTPTKDKWRNFFIKGYRGVIFSENGVDIGLSWWVPLPGRIGLAYLIIQNGKRLRGRGTEAYKILREKYWGNDIPVYASPTTQEGVEFYNKIRKIDPNLVVS
jgi:hypothetical protein